MGTLSASAMPSLEKITIRNFKSIRDQTLELGPLNIFIGANGSGKSNLIEAFNLIRAVVDRELALYVGKKGGANALLHYGRKAHLRHFEKPPC
jgi:predicted ATPase